MLEGMEALGIVHASVQALKVLVEMEGVWKVEGMEDTLEVAGVEGLEDTSEV